VALAVLTVALLAGCSDDQPAEPVQWSTTDAPVTGHAQPRSVGFADGSSVAVEVAADPDSRAQGLMYRPSLAPNRGMLFLFPDVAAHSFWMKNTLVPLDILWLGPNREVVHIERDVQPCRIDPCPTYETAAAASSVLELAAGQAEIRGVRIGDVLEFRGGLENIAPR